MSKPQPSADTAKHSRRERKVALGSSEGGSQPRSRGKNRSDGSLSKPRSRGEGLMWPRQPPPVRARWARASWRRSPSAKENRAEVCFKTALCNCSAADAVTRKVVATETKHPQTPLSLTGKDGFLTNQQLCFAWRWVPPDSVGEHRVHFVHRTICCPLVLSCTGGLTWKPGGSLCGDSVIACELSGEAVSSATALTVRSTLCLESFWL